MQDKSTKGSNHMEHQVAEKQAYIFTRDGFYPDYADEQATQDPMELLYHISLTEHPAYAASVCTDGIPFR